MTVAGAGESGLWGRGDVLHAHPGGPDREGRGDHPGRVLGGVPSPHDAGRHGNEGEELLQAGKCVLSHVVVLFVVVVYLLHVFVHLKNNVKAAFEIYVGRCFVTDLIDVDVHHIQTEGVN